MGVKAQFSSDSPQAVDWKEIFFPASELKLVEAEVSALEKKGVIYPVDHVDEEYVFLTFSFVKERWNYRLILNLRSLNQHTCGKNLVQNGHIAKCHCMGEKGLFCHFH